MDPSAKVTARAGTTANLWLMVSLFLSLLILPLLEEGLFAGRILLLAGLTGTFLVGAMAACSRLRLLTLVLLVVALPVAWATLFIDSGPLFVAHCLLGSAFFWVVGGVVLFLVFQTRTVTLDSVFGAISVYLLFGLAWALTYWAIHSVAPDAFAMATQQVEEDAAASRRIADFSQFVYFSFVTMATLGYGDMTPVGRITRAAAWMQTVTGQFYVAIVIAWLVSKLPRPEYCQK